MPFPNLSAINAPILVSNLPAESLTELQMALARIGYPVRAIDGLYGPNTNSCWTSFRADMLPGNPDLITPVAVTDLLAKIDALATIEGSPQGTQDEVIAAIVAECNAMGLTLRTQHAYVVATTYWESGHTFRPVREAFYLHDPEPYLRGKPYYPYYGRGYVQLTWQKNYEHYGRILQSDLVGNPDRALDPATALFVLVQGFKVGTFTNHKITDYINAGGTDFVRARLCINGTDRASEIAAIAQNYMASLPA